MRAAAAGERDDINCNENSCDIFFPNPNDPRQNIITQIQRGNTYIIYVIYILFAVSFVRHTYRYGKRRFRETKRHYKESII